MNILQNMLYSVKSFGVSMMEVVNNNQTLVAAIVVIAIFLIIVIAVSHSKKKKNNGKNVKKKSSASQKSYKKNDTDSFDIDKITLGEEGELMVNLSLHEQCRIDGAEEMKNLYVPNPEGGYVQIDNVLVTRMGIFCIEVKSYDGKVKIIENSKEWEYKKDCISDTIKFYNPYRQNEKHCVVLKEYLKTKGYDIPVYNYVVFYKTANSIYPILVDEEGLIAARHNFTDDIQYKLYACGSVDALDYRSIKKVVDLLKNECVNVPQKVKDEHLKMAKQAQAEYKLRVAQQTA